MIKVGDSEVGARGVRGCDVMTPKTLHPLPIITHIMSMNNKQLLFPESLNEDGNGTRIMNCVQQLSNGSNRLMNAISSPIMQSISR